MEHTLKLLKRIQRKGQTSRGIAKDKKYRARRVLNPENPKDLRKIKTLKNIFRLYDVRGIDVGPKKHQSRKYPLGRPSKKKINAVRSIQNFIRRRPVSTKIKKRKIPASAPTSKPKRIKYKYPSEYLKKDGTIKKAYRKKATQWRKKHKK